MDLKTAISKILNKKFDTSTQVLFPEEPLGTTPSILLMIPYIRGLQTRKAEHFQNYIEEIKYYGLVEDFRFKSRDDKIKLKKFQQDFLATTIDYESEEWLLNMLRYFYILAVEEIKYINIEDEICRYRKDNSYIHNNRYNTANMLNDTEHLKCIQINDNGRKELLVRRIEPSLSLEEYSEKVMDRLQKDESKKYKEAVMTDLDAYDKEIEELIKMDEFKDNMTKGNTYRRA